MVFKLGSSAIGIGSPGWRWLFGVSSALPLRYPQIALHTSKTILIYESDNLVIPLVFVHRVAPRPGSEDPGLMGPIGVGNPRDKVEIWGLRTGFSQLFAPRTCEETLNTHNDS